MANSLYITKPLKSLVVFGYKVNLRAKARFLAKDFCAKGLTTCTGTAILGAKETTGANRRNIWPSQYDIHRLLSGRHAEAANPPILHHWMLN